MSGVLGSEPSASRPGAPAADCFELLLRWLRWLRWFAPGETLEVGRDDLDALTLPCTRAPQCPSRWRFRHVHFDSPFLVHSRGCAAGVGVLALKDSVADGDVSALSWTFPCHSTRRFVRSSCPLFLALFSFSLSFSPMRHSSECQVAAGAGQEPFSLASPGQLARKRRTRKLCR